MAYVQQLTIGTASRVQIGDQSQEVSVSLTYQLERDDSDVLRVVEAKAAELAAAHLTAWKRIRDEKVKRTGKTRTKRQPADDSPEAVLVQPAAPATTAQLADDGAPANGVALVSEAGHGENGGPPAHLRSAVRSQPLSETLAEPISGQQRRIIRSLLAHLGRSDEQVQQHLQQQYGCSALDDLTRQQASCLLLTLQREMREQQSLAP